MSSLEKLRDDKRVAIIDDERTIGNGLLVTLKQGWSFDPRNEGGSEMKEQTMMTRNRDGSSDYELSRPDCQVIMTAIEQRIRYIEKLLPRLTDQTVAFQYRQEADRLTGVQALISTCHSVVLQELNEAEPLDFPDPKNDPIIAV